VDLVSDPLLLRKTDSFGNQSRDLWICSHAGYQITDSVCTSQEIYCISIIKNMRLIIGIQSLFSVKIIFYKYTVNPN
jgi:hypothetical protein